MRPTLRQFGAITGFVLVSLLLVANALLTAHRLRVQSEDAYWVMHSEQVFSSLRAVQTLVNEAETGQRGYLLTGNEAYLAPYNQARAEMQSRMDNLSNLTGDNPLQMANVAKLRDLTQKKMAELAETVDLRRSGKSDQALAEVQSGRGLEVMDQLRDLIAAMRQHEMQLITARNQEYQQSVRMTTLSIWLASIAALLGVIALAVYIVREQGLRERYAESMRVSEEWFRTTLSSIGDAVIATDREGIVTFVNPIAEKLTGFSVTEARGRSIHEVFPIFSEITSLEAEDPVKKVLDSGLVVGLANHTVLKRKTDGRLTPIEDSAAPIRDDQGHLLGVVLVFRDVTAERNTQDVLRKTEKLAAAARLSATVAHEINNPLAAVVNLVYIAKATPNMPESARQHLISAEQELERIAHIARQALGFYRESAAPEPLDLASLMDAVLKLYLNKIAAKSIVVEKQFENCPMVRGVSGELRQAVSNLIANAIDAVPDGGLIRIGTRLLPDDPECMVEATVADNGVGIPGENFERIFEPFFTTKKDVGTGLGLWAAKTIVERHGGSLRVHSSQGEGVNGTTLTMCLPSATPAENA